MRRRRSWANRAELALAALVVSATGGCESLVGISDVPPVTDATADTAVPTEAGPGPDVVDAPSDADAGVEADAPHSCGDTQSSAVNCGSCGHACLGGSCVMGACQPIALLPVGAGASPFALAQDDGYLYWTDHAFNGIMRTDKVLGGSSMVAGAGNSPTSILASDGGLYWGNEENVSACDLSGCLGSASVLVSTYDAGVVSVAVDSNSVYWSEGNPALLRASKTWDGGPRTGDILWQGDASVGHVAADGQRVYFTASDGLMRVVDVDGGNELDLGAPGAAASFDVVLDDAGAYWSVSDPAQGAIDRSPLSAPAATPLASGQRSPASIASDGTTLYWIAGTSKANQTAIMACAIASCTPKVVNTIAATTLSAIIVDDLAIYVVQPGASGGGGIWKIAK
ncbi:MAG: hypothetical protein ACRENE_00315 [Polyangiaceae bacterium]